MSTNYQFAYHFHPVGQGLFATGLIRRNKVPWFCWVYDCGTSSSQTLINNGVCIQEKVIGDPQRIDLLILSHFDNDHISGVCQLLKKFTIGTLILPYIPLAHRLLIAFKQSNGNFNHTLIEFYINPVDYLLSQDGPGIERILFVPASGTEGPSYSSDVSRPIGREVDEKPEIKFERYELINSDDVSALRQASQQKNTPVDFLKPGSKITLSTHLWEFIPYNDDPQEAIAGEFTAKVEAERDNLLSTTNDIARHNSLEELKLIYDDYFGSNSEERNAISMFLYSGPIYQSWDCHLLKHPRTSTLPLSLWLNGWPFIRFRNWHLNGFSDKSSILYSGDGYLNSNDRLQNLIKYITPARIKLTGVFQVMHHGAVANWHHGVAATIAPLFSVFSSDPERKNLEHPHALVLRDFWSYGAVQVDKKSNFTAYGFISKL